MCCHVGWCGVVEVRKGLLMVCKIMSENLDGKSMHEWWFEYDWWTPNKHMLFGVGVFHFFLTLLVLLYSRATGNFQTAQTLVQSWFLDMNFKCLCPCFDITLWFPIAPISDPTHYTFNNYICSYFWYQMLSDTLEAKHHGSEYCKTILKFIWNHVRLLQ